jgi:hypothetical protein
MSLRWRKLERAVRRRIRKHDARRQMGFWERVAHWLESFPTADVRQFRWIATAAVAVVLLLNFGTNLSAPLLFCFISVWSLAASALRASVVREIAVHDPTYLTLWLLPFTPEAIFKRKVRHLIRGSIWLFLEFALAYWLICCGPTPSIAGATLAIVCAVLQVMLTFAFTLLILCVNIRAEANNVAVFLIMVVLVLIAIDTPWTNVAGTTLANPFAWPNAVCVRYLESGKVAVGAVVLLLLLFATMPLTFRRVRSLHHSGMYRRTPVMVRGRRVILPEQRTPQIEKADDAIQQIRKHPALRALEINKAFLDRVIGLILKPREKPIAEILLRDGAEWGITFRAIVWRFALFALVGSVLDVELMPKLVRPFSQHPSAPRVAFIGLILLDASFFAAMLLMISRLFFWYAWPEQVTIASGAGRRFHRNFRLWPGNHFDALAVIAKVNFVIMLALIPIAILFEYTEPWSKIQELIGFDFPWAPTLLVILWAASFGASAQSLYPAFEEGWRYWLSWLANEFARLALVVLALMIFVAKTRSAAVALLFGVCAVAWFLWTGKRYRRGK